MTRRRSPILPAIALVLATWLATSVVEPARDMLRGTTTDQTTDTYNSED